jgi:hypothetical protein
MPLEPRKKKPKLAEYKNGKVRVQNRALAFARGELTLDDLDDEEIARAQFRNKAGDFRGRPAELIPREFATELMRRHQDMIYRRLAADVLTALKTLRSVMLFGGGPGDMARVKAAELVLQYNIGKVPDKIEIKGEIETWEHRIDAAVVDWGELKETVPGIKAISEVIDADIVE